MFDSIDRIAVKENHNKTNGVEKMAYAYIVTGSEDGIIGVYSNYKSACKKAVEYCTDEDSLILEWCGGNLRDDYHINIQGKNCSADVDKWWMRK